MKIASSGLISLLGSTKNLIFADLWKFTLKNGAVLAYTTWDTDLIVDGVTYASHDVILKSGARKQARGLEVNTIDIDCMPNLTNNPSVVSVPSPNGVVAVYGGLMSLAQTQSQIGAKFLFLQACVQGILDRGKAECFRIFMPMPGDVSLGPVRIFLGEINNVKATRNMATLTCHDQTDILNIYMPRRQFQPKCSWTFGDSNCTFDKSTVTSSSTVTNVSGNTITCGLTDVAGFYNFGSVTFTSGANTGLSRSIKNYQVGQVTFTGPFPQPIQIGDTFSIVAGCSKNFSGAEQQFNADALTGSTSTIILCGLTNSAGFFNGGTLQFTSGANVGQVRNVNLWTPGIASIDAFPNVPTLGDEFTITSISTNTTSTCTGYSNQINFGGQPYIPIPETAY